MVSTPIGSRPEKGSSKTRRSGEWTRAAANWTRCWLPCDSFSTGSLALSARPRRSSHWLALARLTVLSRPCRAPRYVSWSAAFILG